ncbi:MAG: peptidoglycan DD-metalloendopeptidase family protein [Cyclobacteriaceae bacterium]
MMGAYLFKVLIFQAAFALVYWLFLRQHTFFRLNRTYLLLACTIPFAMPLLNLSFSDLPAVVPESVAEIYVNTSDTTHSFWQKVNEETATSAGSASTILLTIYLLGITIMGSRFAINLFKINKLKYDDKKVKTHLGARVFRISGVQSFSFFSNIYIPDSLWETAKVNEVMTHEIQHVRLGHSYDRLLIDLIIALLWINPFIYLFKKWLIEVHEFEADAGVLEASTDKFEYQLALLQSMQAPQQSELVSFFNFSIIKRRIKMMNQKKSSQWAKFRTLSVVPALLIISILMSYKPALQQDDFNIRSFNDLYYFLEQDGADNTPSIFPVKIEKDVKVRVSSEYGMRKDPFNGNKKWHMGMDIAAPKGTPVIATADGVIELVDNQPNGYGKHVVIKHDETTRTKYAQMDAYVVKVGETVSKGEVIGYVGSSGRSTNPHLHYEVQIGDRKVNPADYISDYKESK